MAVIALRSRVTAKVPVVHRARQPDTVAELELTPLEMKCSGLTNTNVVF